MDNKVTRFLFWIAFITFLCASIPHVAWIFAQFEQGSTTHSITIGSFRIGVWQGLSYLIALSIDALVMWLSFQLSIGKNKIDSGLTWSFIVILSALSWYCNWLYSIAHSPASHIDIWSMPLFGGITTVGSFTPFIVSAFPVFSIGYTFMLSRLSRTSLTADEYRVQLEERKKIANIKRQFATDESVLAGFIKRSVKEVADVRNVTIDTFSQVRQLPANTEQSATNTNTNTDTTNTDTSTDSDTGTDTSNTEPIQIILPTNTDETQDTEHRVRIVLLSNPKMSVRTVAKTLGIAPSTAQKHMTRVRSEQLVTVQEQ